MSSIQRFAPPPAARQDLEAPDAVAPVDDLAENIGIRLPCPSVTGSVGKAVFHPWPALADNVANRLRACTVRDVLLTSD